jgi:hypothetical protein
MSAGLVNTIIAVVALAFLAWVLYRPKVQGSVTYKTMVVPLANIMDVGFLVMSPFIVVLVGFKAPLVMLGICLLAILPGFAISYNIRNYEPLIGKPDRLHRWNSFSTWALIAASIVNIAYYSQLLTSLVLLPLGDPYTPTRAAVTQRWSSACSQSWGSPRVSHCLPGWATRQRRSTSLPSAPCWSPSPPTTSSS